MTPIAAAAVALALLLALLVADAGAYLAAGSAAATAADAAALAAAPLTFRRFGSGGSPWREAARLAAANGTRLRSCACAVDTSWRTRTVTVRVERTVRLALFGERAVGAVGRAEFRPVAIREGAPTARE